MSADATLLWLRIGYTIAAALWLLADVTFLRLYLQAWAAAKEKHLIPFILGKIAAGVVSTMDVLFFWLVIMFAETDRGLVRIATLLLPLSSIIQAGFYIAVGYLVVRRAKGDRRSSAA